MAVEEQTHTLLEPTQKSAIDMIKSEIKPSTAKQKSGIYVSCEYNCMSSSHLNKKIGIIRPHLRGGLGIDRVTGLELPIHRSGDASKVRRGPGVPLFLTRHGLAALINAETDVIRRVEALDCDYSHSEEAVLDDLWIDVRDRARLCIAILSLGSLEHKNSPPYSFNEDLHNYFREYAHSLPKCDEIFPPSKENDSSKVTFYSVDDFLSDATLKENITASSCISYIETKLLPHCLRLCLFGTQKLSELGGGETSNGCKGDNDVPIHAYGIHSDLSPLPDPEISLDLHSDEAVIRASRIIRRCVFALSTFILYLKLYTVFHCFTHFLTACLMSI